MTEDVDLRPAVSRLTGRAYRGHEGIGEWLRDVDESFSSFWIEPIELRDLGDTVLALTRFEIQGHRSQVPLGSELGVVLRIEGGRVLNWAGYFSHAEAVEAVENP